MRSNKYSIAIHSHFQKFFLSIMKVLLIILQYILAQSEKFMSSNPYKALSLLTIKILWIYNLTLQLTITWYIKYSFIIFYIAKKGIFDEHHKLPSTNPSVPLSYDKVNSRGGITIYSLRVNLFIYLQLELKQKVIHYTLKNYHSSQQDMKNWTQKKILVSRLQLTTLPNV